MNVADCLMRKKKKIFVSILKINEFYEQPADRKFCNCLRDAFKNS